jgi:hypothetical protein
MRSAARRRSLRRLKPTGLIGGGVETAEARERELEYALSRTEDAIRKRLLSKQAVGKKAVAA